MTEQQKETIRFYTTNDYLLINGLLWGEDEATINQFIDLINKDGRGVMKEAEEQGFDKRWECDEEEGKRIYETYKKRFPVIDSPKVRDAIIQRAKDDVKNLLACLEPLDGDMILYRNVHNKYAANLKVGDVFYHKGFSSCSLNPHITENATYGSNNSALFKIKVAKGTPAINIAKYEGIGNEADEIILPPINYEIEKIEEGAVFANAFLHDKFEK